MLKSTSPYRWSAAQKSSKSVRLAGALFLVLVLGALVACGDSGDGIPVDDSADAERTVVVDGLTSPRGIIFDQDGDLLVAEVGGRILEVTGDRTFRSLTEKHLPHSLSTGPAGEYRAGPSAISVLDGEVYFIVGEFLGNQSSRMFRIIDESGFEPVTPATDPFTPTTNRFSNPYDIVDAPEVNGWIVTDPGGNSLVSVDMDGTIRDYAIFENFETDKHEVPVEMVPTGMARGQDGAIYVGSLTGFPYPSEDAIVWRLEDLNNDGDAMDEGEVAPYVTGLTTVTDIAFGPDGTLYIGEFSTDAKSVFEEGDFAENAAVYPGRVLKWDGIELTEIASNVVSPTGLLATESTLYISEEYAGKVTTLPLN